jgi:coenzyme F420 biosynthesis associated uncharacterized protein
VIDWGVARQVAGALAGAPGRDAAIAVDLDALATESAERVVAYTGLRPRAALPAPEAVDRDGWLDANLAGMRAMLDPATARMGRSLGGPVGGAIRGAAGLLLGAEVGALGGYLGRRVLGQYDVRLLEDDTSAVAPRLLFVAPNLHEAARELDADPDQLVAWVCVHEITHAVQFGSVPWLQDHLAGLLRELLDSLDVRVDPKAVLRLPTRDDLQALVAAVRGGSLVTLVAGGERARLLERVQATMAMVEGHAEHVMDAVGAELVEDLPALRSALDRRRQERTPLLAWLERLIGLDLKLRQYELGKAFCDAVVAQADVATLHRAWAAPQLLPTLAELDDPAGWIARTDVPHVTKFAG